MASQARRKSTGKVPVTRHPLFPAMVALWFGALFGLGSLAVRATLLESFILSLSLDVLVPAAAPPLGLKARLIFAILMAAGGIALGALLARRIARPKAAPTERRRGFGVRVPGRRTGEEELPEPQAVARRRPLTVEEEEPRDQRFEAAPVPGGALSILDVTQIELPEHDNADEAPLALDEFLAAAPAPIEAEPEEVAYVPEPEPAPAIERQEFRPAASEPPVAHDFHPPVAEAETADLELTEFADDEPEFSDSDDAASAAATDNDDDYGRMIEALRDPGTGSESATGPNAAIWSDEPPAGSETVRLAEQSPEEAPELLDAVLPVVPAVLMPQPIVAAAPSSSPRRIETAELSELSPVELIERLAMAMRQRAHSGPMPAALAEAVASLAVPAAAVMAEPVAIARFDPPVAEPRPAPPLQSEPTIEPAPARHSAASPLTLPAALRPIDFGDYGDHDDEHDLPLPPRSFAAPVQPVAAPVQPVADPVQPEAAAEPVEERESEVPEESYPSLLEVNRPSAARQEFVRIEEPEDESAVIEPVVIFPGHGARPGTRFAAPDPAAQAIVPTPDQAPEQPQTAAEPAAGQMRRFDAPAAVAATKPAGAQRQAPEEAELALRSALATLQRMSGAA